MWLVRCLTVFTKSSLVALALGAGCASAPLAPAPETAGLPAPPAPVRPTFDSPLPAQGVVADDLVPLCERLAGQPREAADARVYVAQIPATSYAVRPDAADGRLYVTTKSFALASGAEIYPADADRALVFTLAPQAATSVARAHAARNTPLQLLFRPAPSAVRDEPCLRLGGGIVKVSVAILAAAIVDGPTTLARLETEDYRDALAAHVAVRAPEVVVGRPSSDDRREPPREVTTAAAALGSKLLPCYQQALGAHPKLRGTMVVGARLAADGRLEGPRVEVDAVKDKTLAACVVEKLGASRLAAAGGAMQISLPIDFGSADER